MRILRLIQITRPYGWIVFIGMFLMGMKLANAPFTLFSIIYLVLMTMPLGLVLFGINDVCDYKSDRINPRKKQSIMGAALKINELKFVKKSVFVSAIIMLFISALSFKIWNFISVLLLIFLSYAYSVPPLRLKEIPVLESVSNAIMIYLIVMFGFTLNALPWEITYKAYYLLVFVVAYHIFSTVMDADADATNDHKDNKTPVKKASQPTAEEIAEETTGKQIEDAIKNCIENGCIDPIEKQPPKYEEEHPSLFSLIMIISIVLALVVVAIITIKLFGGI